MVAWNVAAVGEESLGRWKITLPAMKIALCKCAGGCKGCQWSPSTVSGGLPQHQKTDARNECRHAQRDGHKGLFHPFLYAVILCVAIIHVP
ncbi:hypothetical protein JJB98_02970 [Bradyrhizobium diazoefficiens]|nr:hypothetical protein [Bradyrhizobium diazoefficiens]QQO18947.1 hypothetical protein JJB98_02970 [Bradyrhizobium diazoefficiens]